MQTMKPMLTPSQRLLRRHTFINDDRRPGWGNGWRLRMKDASLLLRAFVEERKARGRHLQMHLSR